MTQQGLRQNACRTDASSSETYNGDWLALATAAGHTTGTFNERVLKYLNGASGATWGQAEWDEVDWGSSGAGSTNINEAMANFAEANGVSGPGSLWSSLGEF
jgi:hypothetical protein